jgi:hypothetical protein
MSELQTSREPIATVTRGALGRTRHVGRDSAGRPIEEAVPSCGAIKMMDVAGNECDVHIQNGRAATKLSLEKYGKPHVRDRIREGWMPKNGCPLNMHPAANGPLIVFEESDYAAGLVEDGVRHELPRQPCPIDPQSPPAHGCVHYRLAKQKRRAMTAVEAVERKEPMRRGDAPVAELRKLADTFSGWGDEERSRMMAASMARGGQVGLPSEAPPAGASPARSLSAFRDELARYEHNPEQRAQFASMWTQSGQAPRQWLEENAEFFGLVQRGDAEAEGVTLDGEPDDEPSSQPRRRARGKKGSAGE